MKVAVGVTPLADWSVVRAGAIAADEAGLDAVFVWDHYHSARPEWGYVGGWSAMGALAALTQRVHIVPMVLNAPHYQLGVLAKESSVLANVSGGRFELGIGAGDWPESFGAWSETFDPAPTRLERLREVIEALRHLWTGQPVTSRGKHVVLDGAICSPPPMAPPRIIVGAGTSRRIIALATELADEVNVYPETDVLLDARRAIDASGRDVRLSIHADWSWTSWPDDPRAALARFAEAGVDRAFVACGGEDLPARIGVLADGAASVS
ncbi:MAG: LLM class flavin-dependent oxidoreductase [Chloroflexota bacterium]